MNLRSLYDRLTHDSSTERLPIDFGTARKLLEHTDDVAVTRTVPGTAPSTTYRLTDDEPFTAWNNLTDTYDLRNLHLTISREDDTYQELTYDLHADHYTDGAYNGEWVFKDLDENVVWAVRNDV